MVISCKKESAKRYINDLEEDVSYWSNHGGLHSEVFRRSLARYCTAKKMYEMLTGEEYKGGSLYEQ